MLQTNSIDNNVYYKNQSKKQQDIRFFQFQQNIRCLDCDSIAGSIQFLESPIAKDQKEMVKKLLRKNYNDKQIVEEMNLIFGSHCILNQETTDSLNNVQLYQTAIIFKPIGVGIFFYAAIKFFKWYRNKKL